MSDIIKVEKLTKKYGNFTAVNNISFSVKEGEIFGFLGPNGAGKTTTLEILETLRTKSSGKVTINGFDIDIDPDKIKDIIGVQLQASGFYPNLTLNETISLFASLYGKKANSKSLLEKVDLVEKSHKQVKTLSGGQKQRFAIATTLVHTPKIVFLDEPSTGLDPQARRNLWQLIRDIRNNGSTIVLTTHFMEEAEELCDRVAIIDEGKMLKIDTSCSLVDELLKSGFKKKKVQKLANLEDVFLNLTGKNLREI